VAFFNRLLAAHRPPPGGSARRCHRGLVAAGFSRRASGRL